MDRIELVGQPEGLTVWNVTNKIPLTNTDGAIIGTAGITRRLDTPGQEMVPGTEFGPSGEGFVRVAFSASREDLAVGLARLGEVMARAGGKNRDPRGASAVKERTR